jgi:hypothetical protein
MNANAARLLALGAMLFLTAIGPVSAQAPHIEYVEVLSSGYSGAGQPAKPGPIRRYVTGTPVRNVTLGTKFDMKIRAVGQPNGADIMLRFVWRAPRPGIKDAKTGQMTREAAAEDVPAKIGAEVERIFEFKDQAQIVRGTWRAEVWNGRRRVTMRRFGVE